MSNANCHLEVRRVTYMGNAIENFEVLCRYLVRKLVKLSLEFVFAHVGFDDGVHQHKINNSSMRHDRHDGRHFIT